MGAEHATVEVEAPGARSGMWRGWAAIGFLALISLGFSKPLGELVALALREDLHSHVILIPFASAYLLWLRASRMPAPRECSPWMGLVFLLAGGCAWIAGVALAPAGDVLFWKITSFLCVAVGGITTIMGKGWAWSAAFPLAFLFFMAPIPSTAEHAIEHVSKLASAEMANVLFTLNGTTCLREGTIFHLPGIVLEVAQECSGIRSSYVLLISGIFAANLLLSTTWRRLVIVALVIPLGVLRNGFRIFVIGSLCISHGPQMVNSALHHRGGALFFAISLIPLLVLLWWFRRGEIRTSVQGPATR